MDSQNSNASSSKLTGSRPARSAVADPFHWSTTALAAGAAPDDISVVSAFHGLAAGRLADHDADFEADTLVIGNDEDALERVISLAEDIEGLRVFRAGPLADAPEVEALTPLLINLAEYNDGLHDVVVRFE